MNYYNICLKKLNNQLISYHKLYFENSKIKLLSFNQLEGFFMNTDKNQEKAK